MLFSVLMENTLQQRVKTKQHVWNASTGKQIFVLKHDGRCNNVVFSPDGKYIATASVTIQHVYGMHLQVNKFLF